MFFSIGIQTSDDIDLEGNEDDENLGEDYRKGSKILLCLLAIDKKNEVMRIEIKNAPNHPIIKSELLKIYIFNAKNQWLEKKKERDSFWFMCKLMMTCILF